MVGSGFLYFFSPSLRRVVIYLLTNQISIEHCLISFEVQVGPDFYPLAFLGLALSHIIKLGVGFRVWVQVDIWVRAGNPEDLTLDWLLMTRSQGNWDES